MTRVFTVFGELQETSSNQDELCDTVTIIILTMPPQHQQNWSETRRYQVSIKSTWPATANAKKAIVTIKFWTSPNLTRAFSRVFASTRPIRHSAPPQIVPRKISFGSFVSIRPLRLLRPGQSIVHQSIKDAQPQYFGSTFPNTAPNPGY